MSDLISPDKIEEVFSRLPDGVFKHFAKVYDGLNSSRTICVGEWSRSFDISQRDIQDKHSRSELGTSYYSFIFKFIDNKVAEILLSLIPDFVESIDDAETWLVMSDYWEELGSDKAIACRAVAENLDGAEPP